VLNDTRKEEKFYTGMAEKVSRVVQKVRWGKNYEHAREVAANLGLVLANPGHVCETRFASSERKVYKVFLGNWLTLLTVVVKLKEKETDQGEKKILGNLITMMVQQVWLIQLMGLVDILRVMKDVSLFCQTVNALEWEKLERMHAAQRRIKETLVTQLESGELQTVDFPFLSQHAADLKRAVWHGKTLKLLPAAGSDAAVGFKHGLNNLKSLCLSISNNWFSRMLGPSKVPKIFADMAGCLDLRKLIRPVASAAPTVVAPATAAPSAAATSTAATAAAVVTPTVAASPSPAVEAAHLRKLHEWYSSFNVINELLPSVEALLEQHVLLRARLEAAAKDPAYQTKWAAELAGGGVGTTIMRNVVTEERFYKGAEGWLFVFNHSILKTSNEALVESMGGVLDRHATGGRHLQQPDYAKEAFIHWNGPRPHKAERLLAAALDRHFGKKPWHFTKADRGRRAGSVDRAWGQHKEFKVSKVVDRLAGESSRVPFLADGGK